MNLINRLLLLSAMLACIPLQAIARDSVVVFNEIHYHPANDDSSLEYVELYNQFAIELDLSNWRIDGDIDFDFPEGTIIPGRGYLVIAKDPAALSAATGYNDALGPTTGTCPIRGIPFTSTITTVPSAPRRGRDLPGKPPRNWKAGASWISSITATRIHGHWGRMDRVHPRKTRSPHRNGASGKLDLPAARSMAPPARRIHSRLCRTLPSTK